MAYISEIGYQDAPPNFIEVALPTGTDPSGYALAVYNASGVFQGSMPLPASPDSSGFGLDVYSVDDFTPGFIEYGASEAIALIGPGGAVVQFLSFEGDTVTASGGPAAGETSTDLGFLNSGETFETSDQGATYFTQTTPNQGTVPCFGPETLIATPQGPRTVGTLRRGDPVDTLDYGPLPIVWIRAQLCLLEPGSLRNRPVLIRAGALGPGRPSRDLIVSPQHRLLVSGGQLPQLGGREYLAPAKALTDLPGIRYMHGKRRIVWHHFALSRHAIVFANGSLAESFYPGPYMREHLPRRDARQMGVFALSGITRRPDPQRARPFLSVTAFRSALERHGGATG